MPATEKRNALIDPAPGEEMDAITAETMKLAKPVIEKLRVLVKE